MSRRRPCRRSLEAPGRSSPSFLIAMAVLGIATAAYVGWRIWAPTDVARSEHIVRQFSKEAAHEVRSYRRELRRLIEEGRASLRDAELAQRFESMRTRTIERIAASAESARQRIEDLERISLKTQRNRWQRIERRLEEAKGMIAEVTTEMRARLAGEAPITPRP